MVKLSRGGNSSMRGRQKPRPLFPPGELPLFGPPPAYMRRPGPPHIPPPRGPMGYDYGPIGYDYGPPHLPHRPPPMRPPHLGPPMLPPPHMTLRRRPGPPPPPMPLLQAPIMPPRPMPFMRGRGGMPPRLMPGKGRFLKGIQKKGKNRKNKKGKEESIKTNQQQKKDENVLEGPWISDVIKVEIEKMNELKKTSEDSKSESDITQYNEQKTKVQSMASTAKLEHIGSQPEKPNAEVVESAAPVVAGELVEIKNGTEQK